MGKGKKLSSKKGGPVKLTPQDRTDVTDLVDKLIKKCAKVASKTPTSPKQEYEEFVEIYNIVEKIRELEKGVTLPTYNRKEQIDAFFLWAAEKGIKVCKVTAKEYPGEGYGLVCTENVAAGDVVLEVPISAMLTEKCASKTYLGPLISRDPILQEMGNVRLSLHLLLEYLEPASKWAPYLRSLPACYHTPLYCTPKQMHRLMHSPTLESVVRQYRNIARQYAYFYRIVHRLTEARGWPLKHYFTFDAYRWAATTVMTRINRIPDTTAGVPTAGDAPTMYALVPGWDLANHAVGKMSTDFLNAEQKLVCYASAALEAGQQFTIHYGDRSNVELFLHSGFVAPDNPSDSVLLRLGLSRTDPLYDAKQRQLVRLGVVAGATADGGAREPTTVLPGPQPISTGLTNFALVFCADKEFLDELEAGPQPAEVMLVAEVHVKAAITFLHTRLVLLLRGYDGMSAVNDQKDGSPLDSLISELLESERKLLDNARQYLAGRIAQH